MEIKIYTLGTSNRSLEEFLEILKIYQIQNLIDVRRWPTSKYFSHFKKENLEKILAQNYIDYFHFEKLGGYRTGGYEEYTKQKEFKNALKELIKIAKIKPSLIICTERLPWKCHRAFIGRELEKRKIKVIYIIEKDRIWEPKKETKEIKPICQKLKIKKVGFSFPLERTEEKGKNKKKPGIKNRFTLLSPSNSRFKKF